MEWGIAPRRKIAVVGSGIAGLSAAWLLGRTHSVTLYEADDRLGGHANTVVADTPAGPVAVDTGFIVYNDRNYPNLTALLNHLGVASQASDMSFAASLDGGRLEYGSRTVNGFVGQRSNLMRPRFWMMLRDILRFYREAPALLGRTDLDEVTLGEYLDGNGYAEAFIEDHLLPMGAAIWSTTAREMRAYPLLAFVGFFAGHGLLDLVNRPKWRTVTGGSMSYVRKLSEGLTLRLGSPVAAIRRRNGMVEISGPAGDVDVFDDVVVATHADQALRMLADADETENATLGAFRYTDNLAVLHSDPALMPRRRRVWSSWNYIGEGADDTRQLCVTYWMNLLQDLDRSHHLFLTLNPIRPIAPGKTVQAIAYTHPLFDRAAIAAQRQLWRLQGMRNTWFCGSYFGHGFHEDALQSGLLVAEQLGGESRPWTVAEQSGRIALRPRLEAAE
jgi:uncharacterized protein